MTHVTDDFGNGWYWSNTLSRLLVCDQVKLFPKYYPRLKGFFVEHKDYDYKLSVKSFHENDVNCNTCKHLQRSKHDKDKFGTLVGSCQLRNKPISFHPEDSMFPTNRNCYDHR